MIPDFGGVTLKDPDTQSPGSWQTFQNHPTSSEVSPVICIPSKFLLTFPSGDFFLRKFPLGNFETNQHQPCCFLTFSFSEKTCISVS